MKRFIIIAGFVGACSLSQAADLIANGDFNAVAYPAGNWVSISSLPGWNIDPVGNVAGIGVGYLGSPTQMIDLSGTYDGTSVGQLGSGINQTISDVAGATYTATFFTYIPFAGSISFYLDGNLIASGLGTGLNAYSFTGSGSDNLNFISDFGDTTHLGSVSVVGPAVPGPEAALVPALTGLIALRRRRK